MCDITNSLRNALDTAIAQPSLLGLNPFKVWIVLITNSGVDVFGNNGTRVRTDSRLTVGPVNYDINLNGDNQDGYLNPHFSQVKANDIFLSGGLLTDKNYKLGPVIYPYSACQTGELAGTNLLLTNPEILANQNIQLFFKVIGPGLPSAGQYFRRVWSREDSNLAFYLYLEATGEIPA